MDRSRRLEAVLAVLLVVFGAVRVWRTVQRAPGIDFYQAWVVGQVVGRGDVSSIYADDSRAAAGQEFLRHASAPDRSERQRAAARMRQVLAPVATPFHYAVLRPFGSSDYETALDAFTAFSLASLLAGLFVLGHVLRYGVLERLLFMALVVHIFQPLLADVRVGNVNQIQLGLLALYAYLAAGARESRQAAAGAVLGAAVAFKPTLAWVAPLMFAAWALAKQWRRLAAQTAGAVVGVVASVIVGAAFFGSFSAWADWLAALRAAPLTEMPVDIGNVAPLAVAERWLGVDLGLAPAVVAPTAVAAALWRARTRPATVVLDLQVIAAGCLVLLVSSPLVWQHYLILALPAVLVLLRPDGSRRPWLPLVAFVALAIDPYADLFGIADPARQALVVVAGLGLLFVLLVADIAGDLATRARSE